MSADNDHRVMLFQLPAQEPAQEPAAPRHVVWELLSTDWTDSDRVECAFVDADTGEEAIVSVWVRPHDGYREEFLVFDVEGAPIDNAELRVEAHRRRLVDEFWMQQKRWRC